jgi:ribosomal protein S16
MYTYTEHLLDKEVHAKEGQFVGGVAIGIILFGQTGYALPPGSVENATTFKYPVYYRAIPAASVERVVSPRLDPEVLEQLIQTGKEMEEQGCRAVVGACGYFGNYLPEVTKHLSIPCFFSSIMQVPTILCSMKGGKKVGIICADGRVLSSAPVLANCGVKDRSSVVVVGAETLPEMEKILKGVGHYNPYLLEKGIVELAKDMVKRNPEVGAVLLECTLFPTHAHAVQEAVRMPVYDFSTLIDWVYSAVVRRPFAGYI